MRRVFILIALFATSVQAQTPFSLTDALARTPQRPAVVSAHTELQDAALNRQRVAQDPLAVRSDKLQARQRLELARVSYVQTFYTALQEIASAYTGVLGAREGVAVARRGVELGEKVLELAQIRFEGGSAVQADLDEAQVSLSEARNGLRSAQDGLTVALSNLGGLLGRELSAAQVTDFSDTYLVPVPALDTVFAAAAQHPTVVQAAQGLAAAELAATVLDPSYASPTQLESAQSARANARAGAAEARRGFQIQVRTLFNQAQSARESYRVAQETLRTTNEQLAIQQQRFTGGLISRLALSQAELQSAQAEQSAQGARYALLNALLELQSGTLVDLAGPAVLDAPAPEAPKASRPAALTPTATAKIPATPVTGDATPNPETDTTPQEENK